MQSEQSTSASTGCDGLRFFAFVKICEKISSSKDRRKKYEILRTLFDSNRSQGTSLFPIVRLLMPLWDRERSAYGLKQNVLAKKYIKVLSLPDKDPAAVKLMQYRDPGKAGSSAGDFADVAYSMLRNEITIKESELTIRDINRLLNAMSSSHASSSPGGLEAALNTLVTRLSAIEQKWIIRIILKSLHIGLGYRAILNTFHPDAVDMYDTCANLLKVCETLLDPTQRLNEIGVNLNDPFRPMLSERCDVQNLNINGPHYVETKWDGERFQLHYCKGKFKYYSRQCFDYSSFYGEDGDSGYFTPKIVKQFNSDVESCILDGEMMGWNTNRNQFGSKAMNFDVKKLKVDNIMQPCFCVFDILYHNGKVITNVPYKERVEILDTVFTSLEGVIILTKRKLVNTTDEVLQCLNEAIDNREEGIVMKMPNSVYKPNSRNSGWFKIKPEYTEGAMEELDLLIVGGYYGEGRQSGIISQFLVGLAKSSSHQAECSSAGSLIGDYVTLCRVSSGLSDGELSPLVEKLKTHWTPFQPDKPKGNPDFLIVSKEKPDVWINPDQSVVLQVKATEIVKSDFFSAGYSLRFPRIVRVRFDKPWYDSMTTHTFNQLRMVYDGKLTAGHIFTKADLPFLKGKRKAGDNRIQTGIKHIKMDTESNILQGKEFHIVSGTNDITVELLEKVILKHKGRIVSAPVPNLYCIVGGKSNLRLKNLVKARKNNIVNCEWLLRCDSSCRLIPWLLEDMISRTEEMEAAMESFFRDYLDSGDVLGRDEDEIGNGDCGSPRAGSGSRNRFDGDEEDYCSSDEKDPIPPSYEYITEIVTNLEQYKSASIREKDVGPLHRLLFGEVAPNLFGPCTVYFDIYAKVNTKKVSELLDVSHICYEMYHYFLLGGRSSQTVNGSVTHVIMHDDYLDNCDKFRKVQSDASYKFKLISSRWIKDSISGGKLISDLADYIL